MVTTPINSKPFRDQKADPREDQKTCSNEDNLTPLTSKCLFVNLLIVRSVLLSQSQKNLFLRRHIFTHFISHEKKVTLIHCCCSNISLQRKYRFKQAKLRRSNNLLFINLSSIGTHFKAISSP